MPLQEGLFRVTSLTIAVLSLLVVTPLNSFQELPIWVDVCTALLGFFALYCFFASRRGRQHAVTLFIVLVAMLDLIWFLNAGSDGSLIYYFFPAALYPLAIFRGWKRWVSTLLLPLDIAALFAAEKLALLPVIPFPSEIQRNWDLATGLFCALVSLFVVGWLIMEAYDRERRSLGKTAEALALRERNYREIFNASDEAIILHDPDTGVIVDLNYSTLRMLGWESKDELMAAGAEALWNNSPRDAERARKVLLDTVEQGPQVTEWCVKRRDGELIWAEISMRATLIGGRRGVLSVARDITGRKREADEAQRLREELQQAQKMESVGRLAGGVAHDFNNLITAVQVNANLALRALPPEAPARENLEEILAVSKRSAEMTAQMLAFARRQPVSPRLIDLNETVDGTLKMVRPILGEGIELVWRPSSEPLAVHMDPIQVHQVLTNLCLNARDAIGQKGGRIVLETAVEHIPVDEAGPLADARPGRHARLSVGDSGCGIDDEVRPHIFEPFFTTKEGKGTGLGLATVYGIVRQNNGWIELDSRRDAGSTFHVFLPALDSPVPADQHEQPQMPAKASGEVILLVEDERSILRATSRALGLLGYKVLPAARPSEALDLTSANSGKIDLLITDVIMPGMNGRDLALRLRESHPGLKTLFVSGYSADVLGNDGVMADGIEFMAKPFTVSELAARVATVLKPKSE